MCLKYILLTLGNINISFIYYFSNKVLNQKQSVCYLFTTQRNTDNIFNTQTSNIQNSVQGSIENIDTEYSSYVPGSRSSSWPLSHKHSSKVTRLSCLSLAHPSKSLKFCWDQLDWMSQFTLWHDRHTAKGRKLYPQNKRNKICKTSFSYIFSCN